MNKNSLKTTLFETVYQGLKMDLIPSKIATTNNASKSNSNGLNIFLTLYALY